MAFKTGEQVVCIKKGSWNLTPPPTYNISVPIYNEIYTISNIINDGGEYLALKELPSFTIWASNRFRKLDYNFVEEVLEMIMDEQLIKIGL